MTHKPYGTQVGVCVSLDYCCQGGSIFLGKFPFAMFKNARAGSNAGFGAGPLRLRMLANAASLAGAEKQEAASTTDVLLGGSAKQAPSLDP